MRITDACPDCPCECHTPVEVPGPHIPTCVYADPDYVAPGDLVIFGEPSAEELAADMQARELERYLPRPS